MFNLGFFELIVVIVVGLIVLGPEKFPKAARQVARFMNELKRAFTEIKSGFSDIEEETKKILQDVQGETNWDTLKPEWENIQKKAHQLIDEVKNPPEAEELQQKTKLETTKPSEAAIESEKLKTAQPTATDNNNKKEEAK